MRTPFGRLLILGCVLVLCGAARADEGKATTRGHVKIVIVDDDGNRHERESDLGEDGPSRPYLGVEVDDDADGARVVEVYPDTAAERAGLKAGDTIVRFDGARVDGPAGLTTKILESAPGRSVDIEVQRAGKTRTLVAELGERNDGIHGLDLARLGELGEKLGDIDLDLDFDIDLEGLGAQLQDLEKNLGNMRFEFRMPQIEGAHPHVFMNGKPKLGVQLVETTPELREHLGGHPATGVLVSRVLDGAPADRAGIRVGDLITAVDGHKVVSAVDIRQALADKDGDTADVQVIRDHRVLTIEVDFPEVEEEDVEEAGQPAPRHSGRDVQIRS
jgi:S1-C subfamily serine protease